MLLAVITTEISKPDSQFRKASSDERQLHSLMYE